MSSSAAAVPGQASGPQTNAGASGSSAGEAVTVDDGNAAALKEGEVVAAAIEAFEVPEYYELIEKPERATSKIWNYGVKLKNLTTGKVGFACLSSAVCRDNSKHGHFIAITATAASNATDHIRLKHKAGASTKTVTALVKTDRLSLRIIHAKSSAMFKKDVVRFLAMTWVKCHIIEGFCPLSHGEKEWVQTNLSLTAMEKFPVTAIHNKATKHMVIELYAATASRFKKELAAEIGSLPLLHLTLDLWVDKCSSLKYIGARLFYIDRKWELKSRLLAVRQFNPSKEMLESERLSGLLEDYLKSVLEEFDLDATKLFSATSDAGSDVKRLCNVLLPGLWEWCICHVINCALVEAFGTHVDPALSRNPEARKVIMRVKKVVEHIRKSPGAKGFFDEEQVRQFTQCSHRKLVNAVPQRWSGVANVLEAAIVNLGPIQSVYAAESKECPLTAVSKEVVELYSLIKPAAQVIVQCQQTLVPTGQAAVLSLAALKLTTLNVGSPLAILTPARTLSQGGTGGIGGGEQAASSTLREHSSLSEVARTTRQHLREAIDWRWFDRRYKSVEHEDTDYVFDFQMALHPTTADLQYVDKLASTPAYATSVKYIITEKLVALAVKLAETAAAATGLEDTSADEPAAKRARPAAPGSVHPMSVVPGDKRQAAVTDKYASLGLFKKGGDGADLQPPSIEKSVRAELKTLRSVEAGTLTKDLSCEGVLEWWKSWVGSYPHLGRAARVVFGAPASTAVLERDFSDAGRMMASSRSTMDSKFVDMILFLHGNLDLIPQDIPKLANDGRGGAVEKIPRRLSNPIAGLDDLDGTYGPVDLTDKQV